MACQNTLEHMVLYNLVPEHHPLQPKLTTLSQVPVIHYIPSIQNAFLTILQLIYLAKSY